MANEILTFTEVDTELGCGFAPPNVYAEMEERDFSSAAEFYAFCRKLLGGLYDEYDFEKLVPVTDENAERVSRALASLGLYEGERMGNLTVNRLFGRHRVTAAPGKKTFTYLFTRVAPSRPEDRGTDRDPDALMS